MPGFLLHSGAAVTCPHLGPATPVQVIPQVCVGGQPIVTQACNYRITGCQFPTMTTGAPPCVTASWVHAATQVWSHGAPVLLTDSQSICAPTPGPLIITATQFAVSGR